MTLETILYGSSKKVWWQCKKGHEWEATIVKRTKSKNRCPYCVGVKVEKGVTDLLSQRPDLAEQWDYEKNYPLKPDEILLGSNKKVHRVCKTCGLVYMIHQDLYYPYL